MVCARACLLAGLLEGVSVCGPVASASEQPELTVRVYDLAHVQSRALRRAQQVAGRILQNAGIRPVWAVGNEDARESRLVDADAAGGRACNDALRPAEVSVRLAPAAPPGLPPLALGFALPCARYGVQVTLFVDRIERAAARVPPSYATVLGHALAHEVGHVLLRSERHASTGLMRAVWSREDWQRMSASGLWLTAEEAAAIRGGLPGVPRPPASTSSLSALGSGVEQPVVVDEKRARIR